VSTDISEEHVNSIFKVKEIISARNQQASRWQAWFLAEIIPSTLKIEVTLNGLHCVISQKLILFITTAAKTSNLNKT
jgi:hypothetical protein